MGGPGEQNIRRGMGAVLRPAWHSYLEVPGLGGEPKHAAEKRPGAERCGGGALAFFLKMFSSSWCP